MDIAKPVCLFAVECRIHDMGAFDRLELLAGIPAKVACFGRCQSRHDGDIDGTEVSTKDQVGREFMGSISDVQSLYIARSARKRAI
jgi:hypothetical protein